MIPYRNRKAAGEALADLVASTTFEARPVVLALPRGGVPVAKPVADRLGVALDVLIVRKLGVPTQPELAMGAICDEVRVLDERLIRSLGITTGEIESVADREREEMKRRSKTYRPAGRQRPPIEGASVIVIDDGIATGSTMAAACRALRSRQPAEIVIAVPVASRQAIEMLEPLADRILALEVPHFFGAVGSHYLDFRQTTDDEVRSLLE